MSRRKLILTNEWPKELNGADIYAINSSNKKGFDLKVFSAEKFNFKHGSPDGIVHISYENPEFLETFIDSLLLANPNCEYIKIK